MKLFRLKSNLNTIVKVDESFEHPEKGFCRCRVYWTKSMENGPSCQWMSSTQHKDNLILLNSDETKEIAGKVENYMKRFDSVNVRP